ncbi:MAG TPA: AAA family ATPase [bacterium]|nr:AAA family ATPase [bacterium]
MRARHGLVVGKFYPPHAGHHLLVRAASDACERVTVVATAASVESIPLEERVAWMREVHAADRNVSVVGIADDHPVDYASPAAWDAHVRVFCAAIAQVTEESVDAVFTSEAYGEELARRFSARHVAVDPDRALAPVSGSAVRANPVAHWNLLEAPVRGGMARRIVLVGAESTGKSTLAREMAEALAARGGAHARTRWVAEFGREHATRKLAAARADAALGRRPRPEMEDVAWNEADFVAIAAEQNRREDLEARAGGPVLVCDTDAFATSVWHERYRGARSGKVDALATRVPTLYLLAHHDDVPFEQDGTRDGEKIRAWMTGRFVERLDAEKRPWRWIRGDRGGRLRSALSAVDEVLAAWRFTAPLG